MIAIDLENTPTMARRSMIGELPDSLAEIYQDDVNVSIWQRQSKTDLVETCQQLLTQKTFTGHRLVLSTSKLSNLANVLPDLAAFPLLLTDIQLLAEMFGCLFDLDAIGLRLSPLSESMCPKFHVDRVPCRLITTYLGSGTEWLPHNCVNREKLGRGSGGLRDSESGLYASDQSIRTLTQGDVALLKGESWQGNEGAGLVHRSPALEPGQLRLLLTLDFA